MALNPHLKRLEVGFYSWSSGWPYRGLTSTSLGLGRLQNESAFSTLASGVSLWAVLSQTEPSWRGCLLIAGSKITQKTWRLGTSKAGNWGKEFTYCFVNKTRINISDFTVQNYFLSIKFRNGITGSESMNIYVLSTHGEIIFRKRFGDLNDTSLPLLSWNSHCFIFYVFRTWLYSVFFITF